MKYYKEKPHIAIEYIETRYIIRKYWNFMVPQKKKFFWEENLGGMVTLNPRDYATIYLWKVLTWDRNRQKLF